VQIFYHRGSNELLDDEGVIENEGLFPPLFLVDETRPITI
jgi:hypothetical protein